MKKRVVAIFALIIIAFSVQAQNRNGEIYAIKEIVNRWNRSHHMSTVNDLAQLYADTVFYYGKSLGKESCIKGKDFWLGHYAGFNQQIASPIKVTFYKSGTIKCSFTKKTTYQQTVEQYEAYLLLQKSGDSFLITGEGDATTDSLANNVLNLGDEEPDTDTNVAATSPAKTIPSPTTTSTPNFLSPKWIVVPAAILIAACIFVFWLFKKNKVQSTELLSSDDSNSEFNFASKENIESQGDDTTRRKKNQKRKADKNVEESNAFNDSIANEDLNIAPEEDIQSVHDEIKDLINNRKRKTDKNVEEDNVINYSRADQDLNIAPKENIQSVHDQINELIKNRKKNADKNVEENDPIKDSIANEDLNSSPKDSIRSVHDEIAERIKNRKMIADKNIKESNANNNSITNKDLNIEREEKVDIKRSAQPAPVQNVLDKEENPTAFQFEEYVMNKFDREVFKVMSWQRSSSWFQKSGRNPDMEFKVELKARTVLFAVECKWRQDFYNGQVDLAKQEELENYRKYQHQKDIKVFIILGVGGEATDPESVYIIPLDKINSTSLEEAQLQRYRRFRNNNFFLDTTMMQLR
jgi:hypothetical protein